MSSTVIILHNRLSEHPTPDEQDVINQALLVSKALENLGYKCLVRDVGKDLYQDLIPITEIKPAFVFNLVESVLGCTGLLHIVPSILHAWNIPYTGVGEEGLYLTTRKTLAKKIMRDHGIKTPAWFSTSEAGLLDKHKKYIVKPIAEEGSAGLDEQHVFDASLPQTVNWIGTFDPRVFFIEEYIDGREFNLSATGKPGAYNTYPIPEMTFKDYPPGKARILGYRSKWEEDSFEYKNTTRRFDTLQDNPQLAAGLRDTAIACGEVFGLSGYFRVDIRVGTDGVPAVLEVNGNPCIAGDSAFIAAGLHAGYSPTEIVKQIIACLN